MLINNTHYKTIWIDSFNKIKIIDQTLLPFIFKELELTSLNDAIKAILSMQVRGAPLIGVTAAFGVYLSTLNSCKNEDIFKAGKKLISTRPTAINLKWAVDNIISLIIEIDEENRSSTALNIAKKMADDDEKTNQIIGDYGSKLLSNIYNKTKQKVNILTHCNAGWLATVDWGTATAPIYKARDMGIPVHIWVDETRPRNQGSFLTSWELLNENIDHTIITDNTGGHLMQKGLVDIVITGSDRTTYTGDVCNKIGTYLKALAAYDNNIPFYVALPSSTIDWETSDGQNIEIEMRNEDEIHFIKGRDERGNFKNLRITPENSKAANFAFDLTPNKYITGLITEHGIIKANQNEIMKIRSIK
tara:strand:+ start:64971 stop:66050 length:1080 start_codon:yes stop_codon:yes gene_type:complete